MIHTHSYFAILEIHSTKFTNHKQIVPSYLYQKINLKWEWRQQPDSKDKLRQHLALMKIFKSNIKRVTWKREGYLTNTEKCLQINRTSYLYKCLTCWHIETWVWGKSLCSLPPPPFLHLWYLNQDHLLQCSKFWSLTAVKIYIENQIWV